MNNQRRKEIDGVVKGIRELKENLEDIIERVEVIQEEEQEYLDNIPENLMDGERYNVATEACTNLDSARDELVSEEIGIEAVEEFLNEAK